MGLPSSETLRSLYWLWKDDLIYRSLIHGQNFLECTLGIVEGVSAKLTLQLYFVAAMNCAKALIMLMGTSVSHYWPIFVISILLSTILWDVNLFLWMQLLVVFQQKFKRMGVLSRSFKKPLKKPTTILQITKKTKVVFYKNLLQLVDVYYSAWPSNPHNPTHQNTILSPAASFYTHHVCICTAELVSILCLVLWERSVT